MGNGKEQEKKPLEMTICLSPEGEMKVKFPLMAEKIFTYGFLKMAEKVLDKYYASKEVNIIKPKHIMDFVRGKH